MVNSSNSKPQKAKQRAPEGMAGLAKGLSIIEAFGKSYDFMTVASAAEFANISRASARRCLLTLTDLGYLIRYGSQFRPTPRMLRLGAAYSGSASLPQLAQVHLDNARDALQESISLAIFEGDHSVFIARAEAARIVTSIGSIGQRLPAYASATGRVLLAALTDKELAAYFKRTDLAALTPSTITTPKKLKSSIKIIREAKLAISDEELEEGLISMAVAVESHDSRIVAAMSISASKARISLDQLLTNYSPKLIEHANALSRTL